MSKKRRKTPSKGIDSCPKVIRAASPPEGLISDRASSSLTKEEQDKLVRLAEIQVEKTEPDINLRRLEFLRDEEKEIELYFNNKLFQEFASCSILKEYSKEACLYGLFILDENADRSESLFVEYGCLMASVTSLKIFDELLKSPDSESWKKGIRYLIDFLKFKKEAQDYKRFDGTNPSSIAHLKAWRVRENNPETVESSARALAILEYLKKGEITSVLFTKERTRDEFRLIGEDVGGNVFQRIEEITRE